MEYKGQ